MSAKSNQLVVVLVVVCLLDRLSQALAGHFYQGPGVTAADILRGRGFRADEMFVETSTGNLLRVTRGRNPAIEGGHLRSKEPILFVHGVMAAANCFLLNSFEAEPKDLSGLNLSSVSLEEPSAKSLPLLALNRGHEIWLLDRRGAPGSQELRGDPASIKASPSEQGRHASLWESLKSYLGNMFAGARLAEQVSLALNQKFWNYSLDEQARIDFPQTVEFILRESPWTERLSVVGHSAGGALTLMALSLDPQRLGAKISRAILWAPAYATNNENPQFSATFALFAPPEASFSGPMPPPFVSEPIQASLMVACAPPITATGFCETVLDMVFGRSGRQQPVWPQIFGGFLVPGASHELAQLEQTINFPPHHTMHAFDHGSRQRNVLAYGTSEPPAYDLGSISNASYISLWASLTDALVTPADVQQASRQLKVPHEYHFINTSFNHIGYFFHLEAPKIVVLPSMRELEE